MASKIHPGLESIIITNQIHSRPPSPLDESSQLRSLNRLFKVVGSSPENILQEICEETLRQTGAQSTGISILDEHEGKGIFRWHAVSGKLSPFVGGVLPQDFSPCGIVLEEKSFQLMHRPSDHYSYIKDLGVEIEEVLLVPFFKGTTAIGTLWAVVHSGDKKFNPTDLAVMETLARFSAGASCSYFAEETQGKLQNQLDAAVNVAQIGFFDWDLENDVVELNPKMIRDWGISTGLSLKEVTSYIHPDDQPYVREAINHAIEEQTPYYSKYRVIRPDGKIIWIEARGRIEIKDGEAVRFFGTSLDITEAQELRMRLATETQKLQVMFDVSPTGLALMKGEDAVFEMVNEKFTMLVSHREYIGKKWKDVYTELSDSPLPGIIRNVLLTGETFHAHEMKLHVEMSSGESVDQYYDFDYVQALDGDGKPYGVFLQCTNVTQRVLSKIEQNELIDSLELEKSLREKFVAALTHDLRTPLTAAKMSAQLLMKKYSGQDEKIINRIISNMDRADSMIRDLLDVTIIKAGEMIPLQPTDVMLNTLSSSVIEGLSAIHGEEKFQLKMDETLSGVWDSDAMKRILENLISNGVKYGSEDRPVTVSAKEVTDGVEISVHNEGNPIKVEDQVNLFDHLKRSNSAKEGIQRGWGIGLTLVKGFTEAMGGTININSSEENGTTFTITIPQDTRSKREKQ